MKSSFGHRCVVCVAGFVLAFSGVGLYEDIVSACELNTCVVKCKVLTKWGEFKDLGAQGIGKKCFTRGDNAPGIAFDFIWVVGAASNDVLRTVDPENLLEVDVYQDCCTRCANPLDKYTEMLQMNGDLIKTIEVPETYCEDPNVA